jgi:DNA-binding IclR family transcriptional regulator
MSISEAAALEASLDEIRAKGYSLSIGELDPNIFSIAAPVRDYTETVIAALSINGPTARLTDTTLIDFRAKVLSSADQLSQKLGLKHQFEMRPT